MGYEKGIWSGLDTNKQGQERLRTDFDPKKRPTTAQNTPNNILDIYGTILDEDLRAPRAFQIMATIRCNLAKIRKNESSRAKI